MKKLFQIFLIFFFLILVGSSHSFSVVKKDSIKVGLYVMSVYDLKLPDKEYSVSFWVWVLHKNDSLKIADHLEVINAKSVEVMENFRQKVDGWNYTSLKMNVVMQQKWDTDNFPFDKQTLVLKLEDSEFDYRDVVYIADTNGTKYSKDLDIPGFKITDFSIKSVKSEYNTNYGDPSIKKQHSAYAAIEIKMDIKRISDGLYWKLFLGLYISLAIAQLTFLVSPDDIDARFGLSVGALFAAVGNKYIVDSILPENAGFSLADKIHALTFAFIFFSILISAISRFYDNKGKEKLAVKIDRVSLFVLPITFTVVNIILVFTTK